MFLWQKMPNFAQLFTHCTHKNDMINRELIRIKVVQIVYAYYENEGKTLEAAEKEFLFSLKKAYELYLTQLSLMVGIHHMATRIVEMQNNRAMRLGEPTVSQKFIKNTFLLQLQRNKQLREFINQDDFWAGEEDFLRRTYTKITELDFYRQYMSQKDSSYVEDRELCRKIYRTVLCENEELDDILEEQSLYWNDDKNIVDTFVLKTIRRFDETMGGNQPLLPDFKNEQDREFALTLFRTAIQNEEYFRSLIAEQTQNWDVERLARMDLFILQIALAEVTSFPEIPLNVTINEYVEIAKFYSTPRSGSYINGLLDTIAKRLLEENKITKQ